MNIYEAQEMGLAPEGAKFWESIGGFTGIAVFVLMMVAVAIIAFS